MESPGNPPPNSCSHPLVFRLDHTEEVDADDNCLFTAANKPGERDLRHNIARLFADVYAAQITRQNQQPPPQHTHLVGARTMATVTKRC
ncbi:Os04g0568050 [Oryza sativa Japonica Group]|uniref:Os04g0568050 protein n=1 Tax=Oryza sativa subsp. japonica TaxID=39947 RepID=A0A0N7KJI9_ORYSJ|nr:Os04g0568050 [Oryza sativa Japonica Group]